MICLSCKREFIPIASKIYCGSSYNSEGCLWKYKRAINLGRVEKERQKEEKEIKSLKILYRNTIRLNKVKSLKLKIWIEQERAKYRPIMTDEAYERTMMMVNLRNKGYTLQQIGERFNVTRERVRQLTKLMEQRGAKVAHSRYGFITKAVKKWAVEKINNNIELDVHNRKDEID